MSAVSQEPRWVPHAVSLSTHSPPKLRALTSPFRRWGNGLRALSNWVKVPWLVRGRTRSWAVGPTPGSDPGGHHRYHFSHACVVYRARHKELYMHYFSSLLSSPHKPILQMKRLRRGKVKLLTSVLAAFWRRAPKSILIPHCFLVL